jgi:hypothetical protein
MKCPDCFADVKETSGGGSESYECTGCGQVISGLECDYLLVQHEDDEDAEYLSPRYKDHSEDDMEELDPEPVFMDATEYRESHPGGITR